MDENRDAIVTATSQETAGPSPSGSAFEAMWSEAQPAVQAFLRAVVPDSTLNDDLMQNTALTAFSKFSQFDASRPFKAWVVGIARFEVMRSRRAYARSKVFCDSETFEKICDTFEQKMEEYDDRTDALRGCMEKMNPDQRTLIGMRYEESLSYKAIAQTLNRAEGAIRTHVCRLRTDLKNCIEKTMKHRARPA